LGRGGVTRTKVNPIYKTTLDGMKAGTKPPRFRGEREKTKRSGAEEVKHITGTREKDAGQTVNRKKKEPN